MLRRDESAAFAVPIAAPRPSPTWAAMPTRALNLLPPVEDVLDLLPLETALLRGDVVAAGRAWVDLSRTPFADSAAVQHAGARLAMMQGNLAVAETRAWRAIEGEPENALYWSLLGVIERRAGDLVSAEHAFAAAEDLAPNMAAHLMEDRWRVAVRAGDATTLAALAGQYAIAHPDAALTPYYRAEALLVTDEPDLAIRVLVDALEVQPSSPALLWYTLGKAYLAREGYREAAMVLEVAASKVARGDQSLDLVSDAPLRDLNVGLARAYLATDRCVEAESIYRRISKAEPEFEVWVTRAVVCQTPTPTLTPWIPVQIGTVTPLP
jgi:tetratricopeptide (TPR) repeat protein